MSGPNTHLDISPLSDTLTRHAIDRVRHGKCVCMNVLCAVRACACLWLLGDEGAARDEGMPSERHGQGDKPAQLGCDTR